MHSAEIDWNKVFVTAEVRPMSEDPTFLPYRQDEVISKKSIEDRLQTSRNRTGSLLPMNLQIRDRKELKSNKSIKKTSLYVNYAPRSLSGYMYSWKSTRWTTDTRHHLQFVIYEKMESEDYVIRYVFHSASKFTLTSTRYIRYKESRSKRKKQRATSPLHYKKSRSRKVQSSISDRKQMTRTNRVQARGFSKVDSIGLKASKFRNNYDDDDDDDSDSGSDDSDSTSNDDNYGDNYGTVNIGIHEELINLKRKMDNSEQTEENNRRQGGRIPPMGSNPTSFLVCGYDYNAATANDACNSDDCGDINVEIDEELIDLKHKVNFFAGQTIISPVVNHFQSNVTSPHIMI